MTDTLKVASGVGKKAFCPAGSKAVLMVAPSEWCLVLTVGKKAGSRVIKKAGNYAH